MCEQIGRGSLHRHQWEIRVAYHAPVKKWSELLEPGQGPRRPREREPPYQQSFYYRCRRVLEIMAVGRFAVKENLQELANLGRF